MTARLSTLRHDTSPAAIRASIAASEAMAMNGGPEDLRPLDAIAADLGNLMAEAVYTPADGLRADWDAHCKRWGLCGR